MWFIWPHLVWFEVKVAGGTNCVHHLFIIRQLHDYSIYWCLPICSWSYSTYNKVNLFVKKNPCKFSTVFTYVKDMFWNQFQSHLNAATYVLGHRTSSNLTVDICIWLTIYILYKHVICDCFIITTNHCLYYT